MSYDGLKEYMLNLSNILWAQPYGDFEHPCIVVTGNSSYPSQLWDWGNWVNNIALRQIATFQNKQNELLKHEKGSVMNFLNEQKPDGSIEIVIFADKTKNFYNFVPHRNIHKPVLAQHVAFINKYNEDVEWTREIFPKLKAFVTYYEQNAKHESGLFYFFDDFAIGVDNDPATFYRPDNSSASIYLNTLMYCELGSMAYLASLIGKVADADYYKQKQLELKNAINETLDLLNKDFQKNGAFHEYYNPENGEGIFNKGFSSWNLLGFNMLEYLDGKDVIEEFTM